MARGGYEWLREGMHGKGGTCVAKGDMGCEGAKKGPCMLGACMAREGMRGRGTCVVASVNECVPPGMHSCYHKTF